MKEKLTRQWFKSLILMIFSVCMMGFSLSLLVLTHFGTDPCSAMNYGISRHIGLSFGTWQLSMNLILLVLVLFLYRSSIGWGTLGNMVLVGYTADLFEFIWRDICKIPVELPLAVRIGILIPSILLFVLAAACYMNSGQGVAPYDAIPYIIDNRIQKKNGGTSHFRICRFCQDLFCSLVGLFTGGEFGIITALMVIMLAPTVQFVGDFLTKRGFLKNY